MKISIIAAVGKNRELGKNNKLLWNIPEDLQHFKKKTLNHPVIMGRKTYESIGCPLPNRSNIIVTRDTSYTAPNATLCHSLKKAIKYATDLNQGEVFIIGGADIYKQALPLADKLYLTVIDAEFEANTFFPDYKDFTTVISQKKGKDSNFTYTFFELLRSTPTA